jgi:hypothetical protein
MKLNIAVALLAGFVLAMALAFGGPVMNRSPNVRRRNKIQTELPLLLRQCRNQAEQICKRMILRFKHRAMFARSCRATLALRQTAPLRGEEFAVLSCATVR